MLHAHALSVAFIEGNRKVSVTSFAKHAHKTQGRKGTPTLI